MAKINKYRHVKYKMPLLCYKTYFKQIENNFTIRCWAGVIYPGPDLREGTYPRREVLGGGTIASGLTKM